MTTTTPLSTGPGQHDPGVTDAESNLELKEVEGLSQSRIVFRRFVRHRGAIIPREATPSLADALD